MKGVYKVLSLQIDEQEVKQLYLEKLEEKLNEIDKSLVFWDRNELIRRTCMSWNFIQERFFFDPRFPKYRVGKKWLFPAEETKKFLLLWLAEQPKN